MNMPIYKNNKRTFRLSVIVIAAASAIIFSSCVSYDAVAEGEMNTLYSVNGASVIMDQGVDKLVVLGIRNDSPGELLVKIRPIGGEIGYSYYSNGSSGFGTSPNNVVRASYLTKGNNKALAPGDEVMIEAFLKNWYLANKNFKHRMEIVIDNGMESHALNIHVTQDDIFDDAKKTFTDNKLGKNDPSRNGAVHIGVGVLPGNFTLIIPLN